MKKESNQIVLVKTKSQPSKATSFARGQKWELPTGHVEIIQVGKTLVQYRFFKPGQIRGGLEMKSIPNFAEAMKVNRGRLVM